MNIYSEFHGNPFDSYFTQDLVCPAAAEIFHSASVGTVDIYNKKAGRLSNVSSK